MEARSRKVGKRVGDTETCLEESLLGSWVELGVWPVVAR